MREKSDIFVLRVRELIKCVFKYQHKLLYFLFNYLFVLYADDVDDDELYMLP